MSFNDFSSPLPLEGLKHWLAKHVFKTSLEPSWSFLPSCFYYELQKHSNVKGTIFPSHSSDRSLNSYIEIEWLEMCTMSGVMNEWLSLLFQLSEKALFTFDGYLSGFSLSKFTLAVIKSFKYLCVLMLGLDGTTEPAGLWYLTVFHKQLFKWV